jgi:hypothetical protein
MSAETYRSIVYTDTSGKEIGRVVFGDKELTFTAGRWVAQSRYHSTELAAIAREHDKQLQQALVQS